MPSCKFCHRFVMIGKGNDVHGSDGNWAHKSCPPLPSASRGGAFSSADMGRMARSPRAMMKLAMGRVPDPEDFA